jgi:hypothetical protein
VVVRHLEAVQQLQGPVAAAESCPSRIGPITLEAKQTGERKAGNPHIAFDVTGAGNVAWSKCCDTRNRKGEATGNTNSDLNRRASLRPLPMSGDGKRSVGHRSQTTAPIFDSTTFPFPRCRGERGRSWMHSGRRQLRPRKPGTKGITVNEFWELHKQSRPARVRFLVREGSGGSNDRQGNHSKVARAYWCAGRC